MDNALPEFHGIELIGKLQRQIRNAQIIVRITQRDSTATAEAMQAGASACLNELRPFGEFACAIDDVLEEARAWDSPETCE